MKSVGKLSTTQEKKRYFIVRFFVPTIKVTCTASSTREAVENAFKSIFS